MNKGGGISFVLVQLVLVILVELALVVNLVDRLRIPQQSEKQRVEQVNTLNMWLIGDLNALLDAAGTYTVIIAVVIGLLSAGRFFTDLSDAKWVPRIFRWSMTKSGIEYKSGVDSHKSESSCSSIRTHPRNWWIDEKTFQLERRAIFSKVSHLSS